MLSLEQIQRLEEKVFKAVELIKALKEENSILKSELESANLKVEELEQMISDYRNSQTEIEEGIVKAIKQLEDIDSISTEDTIPENDQADTDSDTAGNETDGNDSSLFDEEETPEYRYSGFRPQENSNPATAPEQAEEKTQQTGQTDKTQLDIF